MPDFEDVVQAHVHQACEAKREVPERYVVDINNGYHRIETDNKLFAVNLFKSLFDARRFSSVRFYERMDVVETIVTHEMRERYIFDL